MQVEPGIIFGAIQESPAYHPGSLSFNIFRTPFLGQVYAIFDCSKVERFSIVKYEIGQHVEEETIENNVDKFPRRTSLEIGSFGA